MVKIWYFSVFYILVFLYFFFLVFLLFYVRIEGILCYALDWTSSVWIPSWITPMKITQRKQFLQNNKTIQHLYEIDQQIM